ncbi:MAG: hypothetical protein HY811_03120 [Planctomycetes bacterium]|nr:hypothetical protein [Planctomycetota bacterium]
MENDDEKAISRIKVRVFIPDEPPAEYLEKWKRSMIEAGPRMGRNLKASISGLGDYAQKMAKPTIKNKIEFLNPNYRTKRGKTFENIINSMITNIPEAYGKFKDNTERIFETVDGEAAKRFAEKIEQEAYWTALKISQTALPFGGYKNIVRGVVPFAARWLTGDLTVMELLTKSDIYYGRHPVLITQPERSGEFRKRLINRIKKAGSRIVQTTEKNKERVIAEENASTNQLVKDYALEELDVSVNFVLETTQLYLDIQVSQL